MKNGLIYAAAMVISALLGGLLTHYYFQATYEDQQRLLSMRANSLKQVETEMLARESVTSSKVMTRLGIMASCLYGDKFMWADARTVDCREFTQKIQSGQIKL